MELLTISKNLSQISMYLALLQKYNSIKLGADWTGDFNRFCDSHNNKISEDFINLSNKYDKDQQRHKVGPSRHSISIAPKSSQDSSTNIDIVYHEVKTEHLDDRDLIDNNVEQEINCTDFADVELKHCQEDPLAPDHLRMESIPPNINIPTSVDHGEDLTFEIVPVNDILLNTELSSNRGPNINSNNLGISSKVNRWVCGICRKSFRSKQILNQHSTMHNGGIKHRCLDSNCNKMFTRVGIMKEHYNAVHLHLKPHKCLECNKSFCYRAGLVHHKGICHKLKKKNI